MATQLTWLLPHRLRPLKYQSVRKGLLALAAVAHLSHKPRVIQVMALHQVSKIILVRVMAVVVKARLILVAVLSPLAVVARLINHLLKL